MTTIANDFTYSISAVLLNNLLVIRPYPDLGGSDVYYYRHDGTNWVRVTFWPTTPGTPTAAARAGGSLTDGTYEYMVTFYNTYTGAETQGRSASATTSDSDNTVRVTPTGLGTAAGITHWKVYRKQPGDTQYWLMTTRPDTDTYWDDTGAVTPNKIATNAYDPLGGYVVPTGRDMAYWKGRLWMATGDDLYYSNYLDPAKFRDVQSLGINPANGPVYRLLPTRDLLYVLGAAGVFVVTGDDTDSFMVTELALGARALCPYAAIVADNTAYYLGESGLCSIDGSELRFLGADVEGAFRGFSRLIFSIGYDPTRQLIVVHGFTASNFSTSKQLVYHPPTQRWWQWSLPNCAGVGTRELNSGDTRLLARLNASAPAGHKNCMHHLRKDSEGDSPDYDGAVAAAVAWYYELGPFDLGTSYAKQLLFMALSWGADLSATGDTLTVTLYADQAASGTAFTALDNVSPYIAKWAPGRALHSFKIRIASSSRRRHRITGLDLEADLLGNF